MQDKDGSYRGWMSPATILSRIECHYDGGLEAFRASWYGDDKRMSWGIEELELGVRAYNILKRMGVYTLEDLSRVTAQDLNAWTLSTGIGVGLPVARQIATAQEFIASL